MILIIQLAWWPFLWQLQLFWQLIRWRFFRPRFQLQAYFFVHQRLSGLFLKPIEQHIQLTCQLIIWQVFHVQFRLKFLLFFLGQFYQLLQQPIELELSIFSKLILDIEENFLLIHQVWICEGRLSQRQHQLQLLIVWEHLLWQFFQRRFMLQLEIFVKLRLWQLWMQPTRLKVLIFGERYRLQEMKGNWVSGRITCNRGT